MEPEKVESILRWPTPRNLEEQIFLGMSGFYRQYVKDYAKIAVPLTNTSFVLETDASGKAMGAMLMQRGRPTAFESKKLDRAQHNYSAYERELLAIIHALKKWRYYLYGATFEVRTDHESLKWLSSQNELKDRKARWAEILQEFDLQIRYQRDQERRRNNTPSGQVRVLVVGDSGVGKTSLVHLFLHGIPIVKPRRTVGCSVEVKHMNCGGSSSSLSTLAGKERDFFVEIWDLSGHERYKDCRGYLCARSFSKEDKAGIPVPYLVVGNKADVAPKNTGSSGNLVDVARQWVEKQGFLTAGEELPVTESFPGTGLTASATEGDLDVEALQRFFCDLIRRRYYGEENVNSPLPTWTNPSRNISHYRSIGGSLHDDDFDNGRTSVSGQAARYSGPVPMQATLLPPPFSYPQQPLGTTEIHLTARSNSAVKSNPSWLSNADMCL
ncbi:hypothetical protein L7F22_051711 [Adiantum nelumboides]|nr:hypothetical protein [Adiantum nelumboides]